MCTITEKVKNLFPNQKVKKLAEGGMSYAFEVSGKIIRIPKNQYAKDGYRMEKAILDYIKNVVNCVEIPQVIINENPFFHTSHSKIEGKYWNEKEYLSQDEKSKDNLGYQCALFFSELHSTDVKQIKSELREVHPIGENMEKYLSQYFSVKEIDKTIKITNRIFELKEKVVVHNDFYYDNFLLDDQYKLKAVLDFGNSGYYDFHFDLKKLDTHEIGELDLFERIGKYYTQITGRYIDREIVKIIGIHNYVSFLVYYAKNAGIKDEKINPFSMIDHHVQHIKNRIHAFD